MWFKKLQIALIEKDTEKINTLVKTMPTFNNLEEMKNASYLLQDVKLFVEGLKDQTSLSLKQLKKHIDFLKSTQAPRKSKLDIKS